MSSGQRDADAEPGVQPLAGDEAGPPADDVRARFREALERKKARPGAHPGSQAAEGNRMHDGPGGRKRQFRRKSG